VGSLQLKVYGILAEGQKITDDLCNDARAFAECEMPDLVAIEGADNGLGFIIIHPGDLGASILLHWWAQGSILCQHIMRTEWGASTPMDMADRPVVACVWELGLIDAEQRVWRETMMVAKPNPATYLNTVAALSEV
jgi:hypothetical protein